MASDEAKCPGCEFTYPTAILEPLHSESGSTPPLCGSCAQMLFGRPFTPGTIAEALNQAAIKHRESTGQSFANHDELRVTIRRLADISNQLGTAS